MLKSTLLAATFGVMMIAPAFAQDMVCDEATMTKMMTNIDAMTDAAKKEAAMGHMTKAKELMAAANMEECLMEMKQAEDTSKG